MTGELRAFAVASLVAGAGTVALIDYLRVHRGKPGVDGFIGALGAQAVFCLAHGTSLFVFDDGARVALEVVAWIGFVWTGPLFLVFALRYTGRWTEAARRLVAPLGVWMAAVTLAVATAPVHGLVWQSPTLEATGGVAAFAYAPGPVAFAAVGVGLTMASVAALILVETVLDYGPLYRGEAAAVALSTLPPGVAIVAWLAGVLPGPGVTLVAASFVPHVALDAYAFAGNDMFETNPVTRRAAEGDVIDDVATPVFVLDPENRVVDANGAGETLIDDAGAPPELGVPVSDVLDLGPELLADGGATEAVEQAVTVDVDGRRREFVVSRSPLTDPSGAAVGTTLVFTDVTDERRREQRLAVLNRVLRHNLRNSMTVVAGNARLVERDTDEERIADAASAIERSADDLVDVGEKAREFEAVRRDDASRRPVDVAEAVDAAVDDAVPDSGTRDRVAVRADDATVRTDPRLFRLILRNLVENAVEHGSTSHADSDESADAVEHGSTSPDSQARQDAVEHGSTSGQSCDSGDPADSPDVSVTATVTDSGVRLTVRDDGDGIPENELAMLERGTETALEHGTGIGLWIVHWSVTSLGGSWTVDADDGTTITVDLPDEGAD